MNTRYQILFSVLFLLVHATGKSQTPVTSYSTGIIGSTQSTFTTTGYEPSDFDVGDRIFRDNNTYSSFFGSAYGSSDAAAYTVADGFTAGGKSYEPVYTGNTPFSKITVVRRVNDVYKDENFSGFFEYSSVRNASELQESNVRDNGNLSIYIKPKAVYTMEETFNNFSLSYGADNIFSNYGTAGPVSTPDFGASSGNNIERVDMIYDYDNGLVALTEAELSTLGVVINERGGNDPFKIAAIIEYNRFDEIPELGPVISVPASAWGASGPDVNTVVFMGQEGTGNIRPKEVIGAQKVSGVFISLADLGITANTFVYGISIFPNDVTGDYVNLGLAASPRNTPDDGNGGLDLMSGTSMVQEVDPLPVVLAAFKTMPVENRVLLNWTTTSESNSNRFEVLHSADAKDWSVIGEKLATGESTGLVNYDFTHDSPVAGLNYYRLKMIDNDGTYAYSGIRGANIDKADIAAVYPNPTQGYLYVPEKNGTVVNIYDLKGKLRHRTRVVNGKIETRALANGQYLLTPAGETDVRKAQKFMVSR